MLVLTRTPGGRIVIGPDIVITVLEVDRNQVQLGITAPRSLPVWREELLPLRYPRPGDTVPPEGGAR